MVDQHGTTLHEWVKRLVEKGSSTNRIHGVDPLRSSRIKEIDAKVIKLVDSGSVFAVIFENKAQNTLFASSKKRNPITNLPNEFELLERLRNLKVAYRQNIQGKITLIVVELDNFTLFRSLLGIEASEEIIKNVVESFGLLTANRSIVTYHTTSDRFIFFTEKLNDNEEIDEFVSQIKQLLRGAKDKSGLRFHLTSSVGVAVCPDESSIDYLLEDVYRALYEARGEGVGRVVYYKKRLSWDKGIVFLARLQEGIEKEQFSLHYQPIVDSSSYKVLKAEALVRWNHPKKGILYPNRFMPMITQTGLIIELGELIRKEVLSTVHRWNLHRFSPVQVSINLTLTEIENPMFISRIDQLLQKYPLAPISIKFEITEQDATVSDNVIRQRVLMLKDMGFSIALDDFGTGYTSFSRLKEFPADEVKIDRSLIRNILQDKDTQTIVKAMILMVHQLGLKCTVEGIENKEEAELIASYGCDYLQGYHFGKPMSAIEFQSLLT